MTYARAWCLRFQVCSTYFSLSFQFTCLRGVWQYARLGLRRARLCCLMMVKGTGAAGDSVEGDICFQCGLWAASRIGL